MVCLFFTFAAFKKAKDHCNPNHSVKSVHNKDFGISGDFSKIHGTYIEITTGCCNHTTFTLQNNFHGNFHHPS